MERHRIGIVIPAFNEETTVASVVASASHFGTPIVVDDGSEDETSERAKAAGASVVRHATNKGYDSALNSGFARASAIGCVYVITMDADGQHDHSTVQAFIRELDQGTDVVVGVRDRRQRIAESIFGLVASARWGIRDPLCGMKAYRLGVWTELGHFDNYRSIGTELALYAVSTGKRVAQIPVTTRDRAGAARFGSRLSANMRILRALWLGLARWKP